MDETPFSDIISLVNLLNDTMLSQLPHLEREIKLLIAIKSDDKIIIESYLDKLLVFTLHGVGDKLFLKLLDYYKTVDSESAANYWIEYDSKDHKM